MLLHDSLATSIRREKSDLRRVDRADWRDGLRIESAGEQGATGERIG